MCRVKAIASSVERLLRYANCSGSSEAGSTEQMCSLTSFSKHLLKMGVRATLFNLAIWLVSKSFRSFAYFSLLPTHEIQEQTAHLLCNISHPLTDAVNNIINVIHFTCQ